MGTDQRRPAKSSERGDTTGMFETTHFAKAREKRRKARDAARAARRKNRK